MKISILSKSIFIWPSVSKSNAAKYSVVYIGDNLLLISYPDGNFQTYSLENFSEKFKINKDVKDFFFLKDHLFIQENSKKNIDIYAPSGRLTFETNKYIHDLHTIVPLNSFCKTTFTWRRALSPSPYEYGFYEVNIKTLQSYNFEVNRKFEDELQLISEIWVYDENSIIVTLKDNRTNQRFLCFLNKFNQEIQLKVSLESIVSAARTLTNKPEFPFKFYFIDNQQLVFTLHGYFICINPETGETIWKTPKPTPYRWAKNNLGELYIHNNKYYHLYRVDDFVVIDLSTGKTFHRVKNWRANYAYLEEKHGLHLKDRYELHNSFFTMEADKILKDDKDCYLVDAYGNPRFIPYLYFLDNRNTELIHVMEFEETSAFRHEIHGDNLFVFTAGVGYEVMDMRVYRLSMGEKEPPILELLF